LEFKADFVRHKAFVPKNLKTTGFLILLVFSCIFVFFFWPSTRKRKKKGGINEEKKYLFLSDIFKKLTELLFKKSSFLVSKIERNVKGQDKAKLAT